MFSSLWSPDLNPCLLWTLSEARRPAGPLCGMWVTGSAFHSRNLTHLPCSGAAETKHSVLWPESARGDATHVPPGVALERARSWDGGGREGGHGPARSQVPLVSHRHMALVLESSPKSVPGLGAQLGLLPGGAPWGPHFHSEGATSHRVSKGLPSEDAASPEMTLHACQAHLLPSY